MALSEEEIRRRAWMQELGFSSRLAAALEADEGWPSRWSRDPGPSLEAAGATEVQVRRAQDPALAVEVARRVHQAGSRGYRAVEAAEVAGVRELPDPPLLVWSRGEPATAPGPAVAIVGARRATGYGLRVARRLAQDLARVGVVVVSGLARGIDGAAHEGALEVEGPTVAVLGSGPDIPYPPEHADLMHRIEERGGVLTEYLPGTPPRAHHFPRRNRLLVARAQALILVEARIKSGSMTSVRWAADLGREVFVVPGPIDSALSEGPIQLLREGAAPVAQAGDVLAVLGLARPDAAGAVSPESGLGEPVTPAQGRLLSLLAAGPLSIDELIAYSGEAPSRVFALVLSAEVAGLVQRTAAGLIERATAKSHQSGARPSIQCATSEKANDPRSIHTDPTTN